MIVQSKFKSIFILIINIINIYLNMSNSSEDEENNNINEKREIDKLETSEF